MEANLFKGTEEPATSADIEAIEQEYGFTLPDDYKAHLLTHNGGWPTRTTFLQPDPDEPGEFIAREVSEFASVGSGENTLEDNLNLLGADLHDHLVVFADEGGGDLFCLSVGPEDYGSVYYIAHESYKPPKRKEMDQPRQYGKGVHFLAPSFTAFLEGLVDSPGNEQV